jgi:c-di-GMP-binding flagellar brake protein YcgR
MNVDDDRRRWPRIRAEGRIPLVIVGATLELRRGSAIDISGGGACIQLESGTDFGSDEDLLVRMRLNGSNSPVSLFGRVAWRQDAQPEAVRYGIAWTGARRGLETVRELLALA